MIKLIDIFHNFVNAPTNDSEAANNFSPHVELIHSILSVLANYPPRTLEKSALFLGKELQILLYFLSSLCEPQKYSSLTSHVQILSSYVSPLSFFILSSSLIF